MKAVLLRVHVGHGQVVAHVVQLVGSDEARVQQQLRGRLRVEWARVVDDEEGVSRWLLWRGRGNTGVKALGLVGQ